jgi:hypothetical protein
MQVSREADDAASVGKASQSEPAFLATNSPPPSAPRISSSSSIRVTTTGNHSFIGNSPSRAVSFAGPSEGSPNKAGTSPKVGGSAQAPQSVHSPSHTLHSSISGATDFGWDDSDSQSSMSGYSAYSGGRKERRGSDGEGKLGQANSYYMRLARFYTAYNPEKLGRIEEFLAAYKGEEEQLFRILVSKYGAEPPVAREPTDGGDTKADADGKSDNGSMYHYAGARWSLPKTVTPLQGGTDVDTPYWPGNRAISDVDLMSLLKNLRTENEELSRCFLGVLAQHPATSFNGVVYITKTPLPPSEGREMFLGHLWAGRLANNKSLVHHNVTFTRNVLHCTEACQHGQGRLGAHERWRLTVYFSEGSPLSLYRVMWDPILEQEPAAGAATGAGTAVGGELARTTSLGILTKDHPRRVRPIEQPIQPAVALTPKHVDAVAPPPAASPLDPVTAHAVVSLVDTKLQQFFAGFESAVVRRLTDLEKRVSSLEARGRQ